MPSPQDTPFGLAWAHESVEVLAYAADGTPGQGGGGTYQLTEDANLRPVSPDVQDNQTGSSWTAVTRNGNTAVISNPISGTISTFAVAQGGNMALTRPPAATLVRGEEGASLFPADLALSHNSQYVYVRDGIGGTVSGYQVHEDGSLTSVTRVPGLPSSAAGIAAR